MSDVLHHASYTPTQQGAAAKHRQWFAPKVVEVVKAAPSPEPVKIIPLKPYMVRREYPSMDDILAEVTERLNVTLLDLKSGRRSRECTYPRQMVCHLARIMTAMSFPTIGKCLGGRDHTTALHAHRAIEARASTPKVAADIKALREAINARFNARNPSRFTGIELDAGCDEREV